jgi:hypothetical protein
MSISRLVLAACAGLGLSLVASQASADVDIRITDVTAGATFNFAASPTGVLNVTQATPNFVVQVAGLGQPVLTLPAVLFSNEVAASGVGNATLTVLVSSNNNTSFQPLISFISGLTENIITGGGSVTMQTWVDPGNTLFALTTPLTPATAFNAIDAQQFTTNAAVGPGPYSVTARYIFTTGPGAGNSSTSTISIQAVPGPIVGAGLPGLILAALALIGLARRRRELVV